MTFKKAKEIARMEEATKLQLKVMAGSEPNQVDEIRKDKSQKRDKDQFIYSEGSKAQRGAMLLNLEAIKYNIFKASSKSSLLTLLIKGNIR